ncbi:hypothetical protein [Acidithiobacillus sp.]|nr:hypothetical protein [Acidithiobacillus sp.]
MSGQSASSESVIVPSVNKLRRRLDSIEKDVQEVGRRIAESVA